MLQKYLGEGSYSYSIIHLDKDIVGGEVNKHKELSVLCKHPMFLQSMTIWHHIAVMHITCVGFDSAICATTQTFLTPQ